MDVLEPYRRHIQPTKNRKGCPHADKGSGWTKCSCPIWAYGHLNGHRYRRSLGTRDWNRALTRIAALEEGKIEVAPPKKRTLSELVAAYEADSKTRNLASSTLRRRRVIYRDLCAALGDRAVESILPSDLAVWRNSRTRSAGTVRLETQCLRSLFWFAKRMKWSAENPASDLRNPINDSAGAMPFTDGEVERIIAAAGTPRNLRTDQNEVSIPMCKALVLVLLNTGLRISDVAQLRRSDIRDGYLAIGRTQKTGEALKIRLEPETAKALGNLPGDAPQFFWSGHGSLKGRCTALGETIAAIGKAAEVNPCHPHRFRDTFASRLLLKGADIRTVSRLLGHRSIRTTERYYGHWVSSHQKLLDDAMALLG